MANLYVRSIPEELYRALRKRAQQHRNTIAAEIRTMLDENFPTVSVLRKRKKSSRAWRIFACQFRPVQVRFQAVSRCREKIGNVKPDNWLS